MNVFSLPPLPCDPKSPCALIHKGFRTLLRKRDGGFYVVRKLHILDIIDGNVLQI